MYLFFIYLPVLECNTEHFVCCSVLYLQDLELYLTQGRLSINMFRVSLLKDIVLKVYIFCSRNWVLPVNESDSDSFCISVGNFPVAWMAKCKETYVVTSRHFLQNILRPTKRRLGTLLLANSLVGLLRSCCPCSFFFSTPAELSFHLPTGSAEPSFSGLIEQNSVYLPVFVG